MGADMTWMQIGMIAFWLVFGGVMVTVIVAVIFEGDWFEAACVTGCALVFVVLLLFGVVMTGAAWSPA